MTYEDGKMGKRTRDEISAKYWAECVVIHRSPWDAFPRVEVTTPGEVVVADDSGDVCEPMALYPGNDVDTMFYNAQAIKSLTDLAREVAMSALYRPTLGLAESDEAQRAVAGEHINQRLARKARERVMKWSGRTHGDVVHISTANKGDK